MLLLPNCDVVPCAPQMAQEEGRQIHMSRMAENERKLAVLCVLGHKHEMKSIQFARQISIDESNWSNKASKG